MNPETISKYGTAWGRDELVLALYLYCQVPFARTKANNPEVVRLARVLGRTPSSVARKLGNFGAFDPLLAQKGITGLTHSSKADREVWDEFYQHWDLLVEESRRLLAHSGAEAAPEAETEEAVPVISRPTGPTDQPRLVMTRLYQAFFRRAVLSSYQNSCCLCRIDFPQLLVASHIIPWSANPETRTDPQNGLCLCVLHDKAFDRGFLAVDSSLEVLVSSVIRASSVPFVQTGLTAFAGNKIVLPSRFAPKAEYLNWHRQNIFKR